MSLRKSNLYHKKKNIGMQKMWESHIGWGGERNTLYKVVETFP